MSELMTPSTDLKIAAAEILAAHAAATTAMRDGLGHARRCGELSSAAKAQLEHGEWLPWLAIHCPDVSARMAQGYMRIAREWPRLEEAAVNTKRVSRFPIRDALALLAEPRLNAEIPAGYEGEINWPARTAAAPT